ncbi:MAG: kinase [Verrucomicrobiota bacterium]|nr:kinase [Verrucomicrobiota bacterium]
MIITRTPFRVSFLGGGTDYPQWYKSNGGAVLSTTIDKYCYLSCRYLPPFFEHKYRIVYSKIEDCLKASDIKHPVVRVLLEQMKISEGIELHHDGDLPARSGMGSSSAFTVGLINVLSALNAKMISKRELAQQAIHLEQELLKENVGSQDQISAAYGGLNLIQFLPNGDFTVQPVILPSKRMQEIEDHCLLFYTGIKRIASQVAGQYISTLHDKESYLKILHGLVFSGIEVLKNGGNILDFGELLHQAWTAKKSINNCITTSYVDEIYDKALKYGAIGGKLLGAGGGGFLLIFAHPEKHEKIKRALGDLLHVPFKFETEGSKILFYE